MDDYKQFYVHQKTDKQFYYPRTLPRCRGSLTSWLMVLAAFVLFLVPVYLTNCTLQICTRFYCFCILLVYLVEVLQRCLLYFEESKHLISRYEGSRIKLFLDLFELPKVQVLVGVLFGLQVTKWDSSELTMDDLIWLFVAHGCSAQLLAKLLNLGSSKLFLSLWIGRQYGIDYGASMAYSYYHGYLKLILDKVGEEDRNLRQNMENYENKEHIQFTLYKLFILIPKSMVCFDNLVDASEDKMETARSLLEKTITRAGVQKRVYKNSVYKIRDGNNAITYVVAEYASPLKTFKEVVESTGKHSKIYKELQNDIVHQFYITLKNILTDKKLQDSCDLIYYEDKNDNGNFINIGTLLQRRIKQIKGNRRQD